MHTYTVVSLELSHIIECVYFDILDTVFFEILDGTSIRKRIKKIGENNINIIFSYFSVLGCGKQGNETNTFWAYANKEVWRFFHTLIYLDSKTVSTSPITLAVSVSATIIDW